VQYEVQAEEFIEVKSPIDRLRERWTAQQDCVGLLRQIKLLQQNPELVQYAELASLRGWSQPLLFAAQGILLVAVLLSGVNWMMTKDRGKQADEVAAVKADVVTEMKRLDGVIEAAQWEASRIRKSSKTAGFTVAGVSGLEKEDALQRLDALSAEAHKSEDDYKAKAAVKEKQLHAEGDALALAYSGTPVIFSLALIFAAQLFRRSAYNSYPQYKLIRNADDFYLYYLVSGGWWVNLAIVFVLNLALSGQAHGMGPLIEGLGIVGAIVFWLGVYALLLYGFYMVSKDLYKAMQVPAPRKLADFGNKLLLSMNTSFLAVFAAFEMVFLLLCYGVYFVGMH
jgi:hypothetical protein